MSSIPHFFTDPSKLNTQTVPYGSVNGNETTEYLTTSKLKFNAEADAIAVCTGAVFIQPHSDPDLVNLVLLPANKVELANGLAPVQFFLYRGLKKEAILDSNDKFVAQSNTNISELTQDAWTIFQNLKNLDNMISVTTPNTAAIGWDWASLSGTKKVRELIVADDPDFELVSVPAGKQLAPFDLNKGGFEIVLEEDFFEPDLFYVRGDEFKITTAAPSGSDIPGNEPLSRMREREKIHNFIDPVAWYMSFYEKGIQQGTNTVKGFQDIYDNLLSTFLTKNTAYLDLRNENGYSLNYYKDNEGNSGNPDYGKHIQISWDGSNFTPTNYYKHYWPILPLTPPNNTLSIKFRKEYNPVPLIYADYGHTLIFVYENPLQQLNQEASFFLDSSLNPDWTSEFSFMLPNNQNTGDTYAFFTRLFNKKTILPTTLKNTVVAPESYYDLVLGAIDLPHLGIMPDPFQETKKRTVAIPYGKFPNGTKKIGYSGNLTAYWDNNLVLMQLECKNRYKKTENKLPKNNDDVSNQLNIEGMSSTAIKKAADYGISRVNLSVSDSLKLIDLLGYKDGSFTKEEVLLLGITQNELDTFKSISGLSAYHKKMFSLAEITNSPFTQDNWSYRKYELKLKGLDSNGVATTKSAPTPVYVYTEKETPTFFASKDFSSQAIKPVGNYIRNTEEKIGTDIEDTDTGKNYEDYFIEKSSAIKTVVDDFITAINAISATSTTAFSDLTTAVETYAADLWQEAYHYVQSQYSSSGTPDDRPLYWARIKMEVALKSHPFFVDVVARGNLTTNAQLNTLIWKFEELSRNYTGIDFTVPEAQGKKKILICGFDPFQLNLNKKQSNPSGCFILAYHNKSTPNGIGFIQSLMLPVRYPDFDGDNNRNTGQGPGVIEKYLTTWLNAVDMIITISQAGPNEYHIDKYATIIRGGYPDNLNFQRPYHSPSFKYLGKNDILSWLRTTLPPAIVYPPAISYAVYKNAEGHYKNGNEPGQEPVIGKKMLRGPGGNYLSNESFYRVARIRKENLPSLPTGHFHVPKLQEIGDDFSGPKTINLINNVINVINHATTGL